MGQPRKVGYDHEHRSGSKLKDFGSLEAKPRPCRGATATRPCSMGEHVGGTRRAHVGTRRETCSTARVADRR